MVKDMSKILMKKKSYATFEVLTAVLLKIIVVWDVTPQIFNRT